MSQHRSEPTPIPEIFHSFGENAPFTNCLECERFLLDGTDYIIEKAFRQYPGYRAIDVIFDFAICMDCAMEMQKGISPESKKAIEQFMSGHFSSDRRMKMVEQSESTEQLMSECLVSGRDQSECTEYQVFALCKGSYINTTLPPYMISGDVLNELSEILSEKTKEDMGGFFDKHFSPDPDLIGNNPRLIIM